MEHIGYASDKQGTAVLLQHTRGRKVISEVIIPKKEVETVLKALPISMVKTRQIIALDHLAVGQVGTVTGKQVHK